MPPTGYRLEAGASAGTANIAVFSTGPTPSLGVPDVPDGTYFVRVRAVRDDILGPPSNEVQVVVAACPLARSTRRPGAQRFRQHGRAQLDGCGRGQHLPSSKPARRPGLANLASINTGAAVSLTTGAPVGVYYVRVRGLNGCGLGPPSNELVVTVP